GLLRAAVVISPPQAPTLALAFAPVFGPQLANLLVAGAGVLVLVFYVALLVPMRKRNGYRGLHEWVSGTRTVRLQWPKPRTRRTVKLRQFDLVTSRPEGMPDGLGPYKVRGAFRWSEPDRSLVGEDRSLGRPVWLWLRPAAEPPLDAGRRGVNRPTRIRWLACGTDGDWQWDAF